MAVAPWVWLGSFLAAGATLGVGAGLLRSRWARRNGFVVGWLAGTAGLVAVAAVALAWAGGADQGVNLLSEYAQEAPFAIDTALAFAWILRRYLPDGDHRTAALYGVVTTLVLRVAFIGAAAGLLSTFTWLLYLVGPLLIYTAVALMRGGHPRPAQHDDTAGRWLTRAVLSWGRRTRNNGLTYLPPIVLAVALLTVEDPLVWPDGGPAYQTVLANILALLPIPVLVGYTEKLVGLVSYLPSGLGVVGGFLGVKVILFALADNVVPFLNGAEPVAWAPRIGAAASFAVTAATIGLTVAASLVRGRRRRRTGQRPADAAADPAEELGPLASAGSDPVPRPAAPTAALPRPGDPAAVAHRYPGRSTATAVTVVLVTGLVIVAGVLTYRRWIGSQMRIRRPRRHRTTAPRPSRPGQESETSV